MAGDKHVPHIKRHTEGTSNELSFDVLEAASNELDSGKRQKSLFGSGFHIGRTPKTVKPEKPSTGDTAEPTVASQIAETVSTTPVVTKPEKVSAQRKSAVNLSPQDEIDRRKKLRRSHFIRTRVIVVLILAVVATGVGVFAFNWYQEKQSFSGEFASLVDRFTQIDTVLVEVDSLMTNPLDPDKSEQRKAARSAIPAQIKELKDIQDDASTLMDDTRANEDSVALNQAVNAAAARVVMMQAADATFELADMALSHISEANQAWREVTEADQIARSGIEHSNQAYDQASTIAARDELQAAEDQFVEVSYRLTTLSNTVEGLDLTMFIEYVDKRIEALSNAVATSEALLAGDRESARYYNDLYNQADREAVELAEDLPVSIEPTLRAVYEAKIAEFETTYAQAREQAAESDAVVRQYIGGTTK